MDDRKCNLDFDFTPIGQAIKKARNTEHMTRESLAELLDYSVRHVQSIENDGQFPSIQLLFFLARRFHISLDQFLFPEEKTVKSSTRRQVDALLNELDDKELSVIEATVRSLCKAKGGCEITLSTEKEDFSFKMNERSSFMLKLTCDENFNYKL
ncbi:helix-turn-helix domain-containing protein [[Ruminococcus] torques]|uniref:helix-turn-helix domain-containing protein n=1 Tax=[Ruminococcus] torques TaxID=33039 RepID=UPI00351FA41A